MKAHRLGSEARVEDVVGRVLVHDLGPDLRKGTVLTAEHLARVRQAGDVHVVELEPGDIHEDAASQRLAAALSGPGLVAQPPLQSQTRLTATHRGLVRVRADLVDAINALGYISVFTLMDGQAVAEGEEVAGCKVTPVAVPGNLIAAAEQMCRSSGPVVELLPFQPLRTFVVATERLKPKARELFGAAVTAKLGWYGAEVLAVREVAHAQRRDQHQRVVDQALQAGVLGRIGHGTMEAVVPRAEDGIVTRARGLEPARAEKLASRLQKPANCGFSAKRGNKPLTASVAAVRFVADPVTDRRDRVEQV